MTDERYEFPPREPDGGEGAGPRRVPIYDRRSIRPEDVTAAGAGTPERPPGTGPAETAAQAAETTAASQAPPGPEEAEAEPEPDVEITVDDVVAEPGIREELETANAKAAEHLADLQRLQADFANYRKRVLREQTELVERAAVHLVHRLLSVLDSFELAVAAAEETKDFERMLRGVEMVLGELKEVLKTEGLEVIPAKDLPFDPNLHEAALEVPGDEDGDMVVAGVLRPGYVMKGRILRPAMVKVTRRAAGPAGPVDGGPARQ